MMRRVAITGVEEAEMPVPTAKDNFVVVKIGSPYSARSSTIIRIINGESYSPRG